MSAGYMYMYMCIQYLAVCWHYFMLPNLQLSFFFCSVLVLSFPILVVPLAGLSFVFAISSLLRYFCLYCLQLFRSANDPTGLSDETLMPNNTRKLMNATIILGIRYIYYAFKLATVDNLLCY